MGLFNRAKKDKTVDLTPRYNRQQERLASIKSDMIKSKSQASENSSSQNEGAFGFLGSLASSSNNNSSSQNEGYRTLGQSGDFSSGFSSNEGGNVEEKRKKLTKRILDMTDKIEELANQVYHLSQRVEVLEKRNKTGLDSYN